jgi:O-antigen ligase
MTGLLVGALIFSLYFNGTHIEYFAASLQLLTLLGLAVLWRGYRDGFRVPRSALSAGLVLFWAWLAVGLLWSRVPYVSMVNFWWVGSFSLVFWLVVLAPEAERYSVVVSRLFFAIGLGLAVAGLYQLLVLGGDPRSTFLSRNSHAALLILIAIPASAHFLLIQPGRWRTALAGLLFVFFLGIAVTGSRGVLLSLLLAVAVVTITAYRRIPSRRLFYWLTIILCAYLLANLLLQGWLGGRLSSVLEPGTAGHDRFLIWRQAWKMITDQPWIGIGLGTYWLFWPPYRHPADTSAGFYVHNDYLQIWIETGLPGLLLLLVIELSVARILIRTLRNQTISVRKRIEIGGLVGGLAAIAFHSFFDFDLYIQPILIVIGLMLARLQLLDQDPTIESGYVTLRPANRIGSRGYYVVSLLALTLPLLYFTALGFSAYLTAHARQLAGKSHWVEASKTLTRAWQLMPTSDLTLVTHADLLRQAIPSLPPTAATQRKVIYREAMAMLVDAKRVNPVRPQIGYLRAMLYQQNRDLAGPQWDELAMQGYRETLRIDPRFYWARISWAQLLLAQKRVTEAQQVLEGGIEYWYPPEPGALSYYRLTAQLRWQTGDRNGAVALEQKLDRLVRSSRVRTDPFGPSVRPTPPGKP